MNELVSVIVPIYNVESYLPHCLECLASQTYQNLEIILVDDGSTDSSGRLCDEYVRKDSRARVIHQPNKGVWSARNVGQDAARGSYLWFPDGDDYFHKDIVRMMYDAINHEDSDGNKPNMAIVDYIESRTFDEDVFSERKACLKELSDENLISLFVSRQPKPYLSFMWNKLYRRELVKDIRSGNYKYAQDHDFNLTVLVKGVKAVMVEQVLYYWMQRETSDMHQLDYQLIRAKDDSRIYYNHLLNLPKNKLMYRRYLLEWLYFWMAEWVYLTLGTEHERETQLECRSMVKKTWKSYLWCKEINNYRRRVKRLLRVRFPKLAHVFISADLLV